MVLPPPLCPGDTVAVFAGSSPFDTTLVRRGMAWLGQRYRVLFDPSMFAREGYLAGSDDRRLAELRRWLFDPRVKALVAARGGYGLTRIAHHIDWEAFARAPRWILGFSDVTTLHLEAMAHGVATIHGPNVASLGRADGWLYDRTARLLSAPDGPFALRGLGCVRPGVARGPLWGGNLTLVHALAASGRLRPPAGGILLIEDVTERPYRIDRMLTALLVAGVFERVSGVVIGEFTDCAPGPDGVTASQVIEERLAPLGIPIASGAPIGHGRFNAPVVLGGTHLLDAAAGFLEAG